MVEDAQVGAEHAPTARAREASPVTARALAILAVLGLVACGEGEPTVEVAEVVEAAGPVAEEIVEANEVVVEEADAPPADDAAPPPAPRPAQPVVTAASPPVAADEIDTSDWVISPPFYAAGDEPYWRLDIQDGWFVFRRAGLPEIEAPMVRPTRDGRVDIFESPPLSIHLTEQTCRTADGERSRASAAVWFDDVSFEGCAFEGQSAGTSAEGTAVADSIVAVDACLARLGDPALVTGIYVRGNGQTALGLRMRDGRLFECVTEGGGAQVAFLDPVEPGAAGPWMNSGMRFLRGGQGVAACDEAEPVSSGGELLGHMLAPGCRF